MAPSSSRSGHRAASIRLQLILLDTRYHRSPLERRAPRPPGEGPYQPTADRTTTVLGEEQWQWLEQQLQVPAELRLVASSIQVVAEDHHWEKWGNFPHERKRLFDLIRATKASGTRR